MAWLDGFSRQLKERMNRDNPGASIYRAPQAPKHDWFKNSIEQAARITSERIARARAEDAERKRRSDEAEVERARMRQADNEAIAQKRLNDPVWTWAHSSDGYNFLSAGGASKVDYNAFERNPSKFLIQNKNMADYLKTFASSNDEGKQRVAWEELTGRVPENVARTALEYFYTEQGIKDYRIPGQRDYGGPVHSVLKDVTGNEMVASIGSSIANAATFGAEKGSAPGATSGPALWADAAGSVGDRLVLGKTVNAIENAAADAAVKRMGGGFATQLATKAATRAGLNVAEDVPLTAAQMVLYGGDVDSPEFWKALSVQAGASAGAGAAIPVAGAGVGATRRATTKALEAPGAREILESGGAGAIAYATARMAGKDHEEASRLSLFAAALPLAARTAARTPLGTPRTALTHTFEPGDQVFHGTPGELGQGIPTYGRGTGGNGGYFTPDRDNAASYGDNVYEMTFQKPTNLYLDLNEPVEYGEFLSIAAALPSRQHRDALKDALTGPDGSMREATGRDLELALRNMGLDPDKVIVEAGYDGWGWPSEYSDYADEFVSKRPRDTLAPVGMQTADDIAEDIEDDFVSRVLARARDGNWLVAPDLSSSARSADGIGRLSDDGLRAAAQRAEIEHDRLLAMLDREYQSGGVRPETRAIFDRTEARMHLLQQELRRRGVESSLVARASSPAGRMAAQAAGTGAVAAATADGDMEDRLKAGLGAAATSAVMGGATNALRTAPETVAANIIKSSKPEDYKLGSKVFNPNTGKELGRVMGTDGKGGLIIKTQAGQKTVPFTRVINSADYAANTKELALKKATLPVTPGTQRVAQREREMDDILATAETATDSQRILGNLAKNTGLGWLDPATKFDTAQKKGVLKATVAAANELRAQAANANAHVREALDALLPLTQEPGRRIKSGFIDFSTQDAKRAGAQVAAAAAPAAAGFAVSEATGIDEAKEAGILAGAAALGAVSARQSKGFMHKSRWDVIPLLLDDPDLPEFLAKGQGKLIDIMERPEAYDLDVLPGARKAIDDYKAIRQRYLRETNESAAAAGQDLIPFKQDNALFHWFTPESVKAAGIGQGPSASEIASPGFARQLPFEQQRNLGDTYYEALTKHPKLKVAGTAEQLLREEAKMHSRLRSNAVLVYGLTKSGDSFKVISSEDLRAAGKTEQEILAHRANERHYREDLKWGSVPGIDDHIFPPDVITAVKDLLVTSRGVDNPVMNILDDMTNAVRQAMFVGDASAWTMQGAMAFLEDPYGALRNAHHLAGATAFGNRYFEWWLSKPQNKALYEQFSRSGGVAGRQWEGLELLTDDTRAGRLIGKVSIANKPGFRHVETRGFEAFLPIQRVLMWDHMNKQEALIGRTGFAHELGRAAIEGSKFAPTAAAVAAVSTDNELDIPGVPEDIDELMTLALGVAGSTAVRSAVSAEGRAALENTSRADQRVAGTRAAKQTNRVSGNLNRQILGMSNSQAQIERTFLARSPALLRNTLTLAKLAATDAGPDGALARMYLVKTVALVGVGMAAAKWMVTGEWDSFDPTDPESVYSPENFLRAGMDENGKLSTSNPVVSLMRAALHQETPAGETRWSFGNWRPDIGGQQFLEGRLPDITGIGTREFMDFLPSGMPEPETDQRTIGDKLAEGDVGAAAGDVARRLTPVGAQKLVDSGTLGDTAIGDDLGLEGDPKYNHTRERLLSVVGSLAGLNMNPETLGQEATRIKNETREELFPDVPDRSGDGRLDYDDLNAQQSGEVREALDDNEAYRNVTRLLNEDGRGTEEPKPIQRYLDRMGGINSEYQRDLKRADAEYKRTGDAVAFKQRYQQLQQEKRIKTDEARKNLGEASAEMRGRSETVDEWLNRNLKPEDKAVTRYYDLFEKHTDKATGKLDFEALEEAQADYLKGLDPKTRRYVKERVASFDTPSTVGALREYEKAKATAAPFFDAREDIFNEVKSYDPFLAQFKNKAQFDKAVAKMAGDAGITTDEAMAALGRQSVGVRLYNRQVALLGGQMRKSDPALDAVLSKWFGYSPVAPENRAASRAGQFEVANAAQSYNAEREFSRATDRPDFSYYDFGVGSRR